MKKKIISMITALACAICAVGVMPAADNLVSADVTYENEKLKYGDYLEYQKIESDYSESGIMISGCDKSATSVEIPAEIDNLPVKWIGGSAFSDCVLLEDISIPDSVTSIEYDAFSGCESLAAINVSSENNIYASIDGILFDKDKTELKQYPAGRSEKTYTIPDGVMYIGYGAFSGCKNLSDINIPDSVTSIGDYAFYECTSLSSIEIPDSVTSIRYNAFSGCTSLSSINIPDSVTEIGSSAFSGCTSLSGIEIPDSVMKIEYNAFSETQLIETQDGVEYVGKWVVGSDKDITSAEIKDGTKGIACSAFLSRNNLATISIPDSVMNIGENAFYETQLMENQDGINYVDKWVVGYDEDITSAEIKDGTRGIADYAFSGNDNLSNINLPEGLMYIGYSAFYDCYNIYNDGTIEIPASVVRIGDEAFDIYYVMDDDSIAVINIKNPDCILGKDIIHYDGAILGEENSTAQAYAEEKGIPFNPMIITEAGEYNIELAYNSTKDILFCPSESGNYSVRTKSDKAHMTSFGNSTHYSSTYENEVDSQDELTAGKYYMINIDSKLENENFNNWNEGDLPATVKVDIYHVISESKDISELVDYDIPSYVRSDISFNLEEASNVILNISENLKHLIIHLDESGYEKSSEWKSNGIYTLESGSYMLRIYGNDNDAKLNASLTPYTSTTTVTTTSPTTSTTVSTSVSITTDSVSSGTETTPDVTGTTTDSTTVISTDATTDVTTTKASTADTTAGSTSVSTTSTSTSVSATSSPITTTVPPTTTPQVTGILGDANSDGKLDVRDAAYIARMLAQRDTEKLPKNADFNEDGQINVRDAAAIARFLAKKH